MDKNEKPEKLRIITTSNLTHRKKSAFRKGIITTKDLPDPLPVREDEKEEKLKTITTGDVKGGKKDEK